jgi:hypothetical protein
VYLEARIDRPEVVHVFVRAEERWFALDSGVRDYLMRDIRWFHDRGLTV